MLSILFPPLPALSLTLPLACTRDKTICTRIYTLIHMHLRTVTCVCVHIYIYIYIYIHMCTCTPVHMAHVHGPEGHMRRGHRQRENIKFLKQSEDFV